MQGKELQVWAMVIAGKLAWRFGPSRAHAEKSIIDDGLLDSQQARDSRYWLGNGFSFPSVESAEIAAREEITKRGNFVV